VFREDPQIFTFGVGSHACPGRTFAAMIPKAGIEQLLESGLDPRRLIERRTYRASANARILYGSLARQENRGE
jgi:cytochrome P450